MLYCGTSFFSRKANFHGYVWFVTGFAKAASVAVIRCLIFFQWWIAGSFKFPGKWQLLTASNLLCQTKVQPQAAVSFAKAADVSSVLSNFYTRILWSQCDLMDLKLSVLCRLSKRYGVGVCSLSRAYVEDEGSTSKLVSNLKCPPSP